MNRIALIFFLCILSFAPLVSKAQIDNEPINLPKYDHGLGHFGFVLGINTAGFVVNRVGDLKIRDTIYSVEANKVVGLNLGILGDLSIGEFFDLRFTPTLSFVQRNLNYNFIYHDTAGSVTEKQVESTYLEFPFDLKFKSKRANNYRVYVIAGFKYAIDMVSQAKVKNKDKDIIKLSRRDYGYEIGFGFDFYLLFFKFSPEIKMYNGLTNLFVNDDTQYARPIQGLYAKTFTVSLFFE